MKKLFLTLLFGTLAAASTSSFAQTKSAEPVAFWGKEDAYLLKQAAKMFALTDQALTENPPVVGAPMARKLALYNLDAMLHEVKYDNTEPFCDFIDSRIGKVIEDMKNPVKKGVKIYKIYKNKRLEIDTKWARVREIEEEIQNLVKVLAGARTIAYQEIVKEIERLSKSKDNVLKEINEIEDNLNEMPSFTEKTIQNNIVEMKKALKPKIVKNVKPMLTYLLDEIVYSNEEIQVHVNLNAYIGSSLHGTFKAVIVEETDNVKKVENQFKQKLTWNTLCIAT